MKTKKNFLKKLTAGILGFVMTLGVGAAGYAASAKGAEAATGDTYTKVTSASELSDGDKVIFVKPISSGTSTYSCGTTQNNNNRSSVSITLSSDGKYTKTATDNVQEFVVVAGSTTGQIGFHTGSGYIYSGSSSNNYLKTNSTAATTKPSGTSAWTLSFSSGVASVVNASNTSYYLAFNGTTLFSQYKSSMDKPWIYKAGSSKTVTSIAFTNDDMDNKSYTTVDTAFDPSGLKVTATYSDTTTGDVTDSVTFTFNPEKPSSCSTSTTSIVVTATYSDFTATKTIYGIEIRQATTNTHTFVAKALNSTDEISGIEDASITVSGAKESASNITAFNSNDSEWRMYYNSGGNGSSLTFTFTNVTVIAISIDFTGIAKMKYYIDGGTATTVNSPSDPYEITSISATSSFKIQNANTTNTQLKIGSVTFTYNLPEPETQYTVTLNSNGGSSTATKTETTTGSFTAPAANYFTSSDSDLYVSISKWALGSASSSSKYSPGDPITISSNDVVLYAIWNTKVTFNMHGHGSAISAQTVEIGGKASEPTTPQASGWNFGGWYADSSYNTPWGFNTNTVSAGQVIHARWTEDTTPSIVPAKGSTSGYTGQTEDIGISYAHLSGTLNFESNNSAVTVAKKSDDNNGNAVITLTFVSATSSAVTISCKNGDTSLASISVTVQESTVSIALKHDNTVIDGTQTVYVQGEYKIDAEVSASGIYSTGVTWSSSDGDVATVDQTGKVTGVAKGSVVITCTSTSKSDVKQQVSFNVEVDRKTLLQPVTTTTVDTTIPYYIALENSSGNPIKFMGDTVESSTIALLDDFDDFGELWLEEGKTVTVTIKINNTDVEFTNQCYYVRIGDKYLANTSSTTLALQDKKGLNDSAINTQMWFFRETNKANRVALFNGGLMRYIGQQKSGDSLVNKVKAYFSSYLPATKPSDDNPFCFVYKGPDNVLSDTLTVANEKTQFTAGDDFNLGSTQITANYSITGDVDVTTPVSPATLSYKIGSTSITTSDKMLPSYNGQTLTITYTDAKNHSASVSYTISVGYAPATSITINNTTGSTSQNPLVIPTSTKSEEISVTVNPTSYASQQFTITPIGNTSTIATVNQDGKSINGIGAGTASFTISSASGGATTTLYVEVSDAATIVLDPHTLSGYSKGETPEVITATVTHAKGAVTYNWSVIGMDGEATDIISVEQDTTYSNKGNVSLLKGGQAKVICEAFDNGTTIGTDECIVTVTESEITNFSVSNSRSPLVIYTGDNLNSIDFTPSITTVGYANNQIKWHASNDRVQFSYNDPEKGQIVANPSTDIVTTGSTPVTVVYNPNCSSSTGSVTITISSVYDPNTKTTKTITITEESVTSFTWSGGEDIKCYENTALDASNWSFAATFASGDSSNPTLGSGANNVHVYIVDDYTLVSEPTTLNKVTDGQILTTADDGKYMVAFYKGTKCSTSHCLTVVDTLHSIIAEYDVPEYSQKTTNSITTKVFDGNNQTKTIGDFSLKLVNNGGYYGSDATKGQQVGSKNDPASQMTLTTTVSANVSSVTIETSSASGSDATVSVTVGGAQFKCNEASTASLTESNASYTFTGTPSSGDIVISWAQTTSKAIYFKSVSAMVATGESHKDYREDANQNIDVQSAVVRYARAFNAYETIDASAWGTLKASFNTMINSFSTEAEKSLAREMFKYATTDSATLDVLQQCVKKYDKALAKLGLADSENFMNRTRVEIDCEMTSSIGFKFTGLEMEKLQLVFNATLNADAESYGFLYTVTENYDLTKVDIDDVINGDVSEVRIKQNTMRLSLNTEDPYKEATAIFYWVDSEGNVYYSDPITMSFVEFIEENPSYMDSITDPYAKAFLEAYLASLENNENQGE